MHTHQYVETEAEMGEGYVLKTGSCRCGDEFQILTRNGQDLQLEADHYWSTSAAEILATEEAFLCGKMAQAVKALQVLEGLRL